MVFEETCSVFKETPLVIEETRSVIHKTTLATVRTNNVIKSIITIPHNSQQSKTAKGCTSGSSVRNAKRKESLNPCRGFSFAVLVLLFAKIPLSEKVFFGSFFGPAKNEHISHIRVFKTTLHIHNISFRILKTPHIIFIY